MNPHKIHDKNCAIVREALESTGYVCKPPDSEISGVDYVVKPQGGTRFNVQVRSRLFFIRKHLGQNLRIAFPDQSAGAVYMYHLDEMLREADRLGKVTHTPVFNRDGVFNISPTPKWAKDSPILCRVASFARPKMSAAVSDVPPTVKKEDKTQAKFPRVPYGKLDPKRIENRDFHKIAAALADCGYESVRTNDDWRGWDFVAVHIDGKKVLHVQQKGRFGFFKKYEKSNPHIAFYDSASDCVYVYPHNELLPHYIERLKSTAAWRDKGVFHFPKLSVADKQRLAPYRINL